MLGSKLKSKSQCRRHRQAQGEEGARQSGGSRLPVAAKHDRVAEAHDVVGDAEAVAGGVVVPLPSEEVDRIQLLFGGEG